MKVATIVEEMNTLWECRYESGIQKKTESLRVWISLQSEKIWT
jgi:hypothetical protein